MAQVTTGTRAALDRPLVYTLFQNLLGAERVRRNLADKYVCPAPGDKVLDIGCGPGDMLPVLPNVDYVGVDLSGDYIAAARRTFGERGEFCVGDVQDLSWLADRKFDIVLGVGLLHHLDDAGAGKLLQLAASVLGPEGRLVTLDPCFVDGQPRVTRWLISRDRGQNIRTADEYLALAQPAFGRIEHHVHNDLSRLPYSRCVLVCRS